MADRYEERGRENRAPTITLGKMIAYFKYQTTIKINAIRHSGMQKLWQRNYYEHIIRNEESLGKIREYIVNNPLNWGQDEMNL